MEEMKVDQDKLGIIDLLVQAKLVTSKSDARRMIQQNAVKIDGEVVKDVEEVIEIKGGMVLQKGKRGFAKIVK